MGAVWRPRPGNSQHQAADQTQPSLAKLKQLTQHQPPPGGPGPPQRLRPPRSHLQRKRRRQESMYESSITTYSNISTGKGLVVKGPLT